MSTLPLRVSLLHKSYGSQEAVKGVSFEVHAGEVFGLLGPNGAGKTSTIAVITTLEAPTSGTAEVFGYDVRRDSLEVRRRLGVVHQEIINSGFFTVEELLHFQSGYYGLRKNQERIQWLLQQLGLFEHKHKLVKQLSGGMKRRLMIGKALVHSPKLLLLDEPTAGVDISLREQLWDFVRQLRSEGIAVLLTTHYLEEAELLCDRVGILNHGVLEACGATKGIIREFTQKKIQVETQTGDKHEFMVPAATVLGEFLREKGFEMSSIKDLCVTEGSLEDAFKRVLSAPKGVHP